MAKSVTKNDTMLSEPSSSEGCTQSTYFSNFPWQDYLELTKPKVVALLLVTAIIGMHLATPSQVPINILFWGSLGLALAMGGAAAINHAVDQRADMVMRRTLNRPVATGRISTTKALMFAAILCGSSALILAQMVNQLTAILTMLGAVGYAVIYTLLLKRATPQNIVIGGFAGAIPPLLGWTAVTGELHPHAWLLVLIIFVWTPPHFWALAIHRCDDYAKAKIPMLPVTHGIEHTKTQILYYTLLLAIVSTLPYLTGMSGWLYLVGSLGLNAFFIYLALKLKLEDDSTTALKTFSYSIVYLFVLFMFLLSDHYLITTPFDAGLSHL